MIESNWIVSDPSYSRKVKLHVQWSHIQYQTLEQYEVQKVDVRSSHNYREFRYQLKCIVIICDHAKYVNSTSYTVVKYNIKIYNMIKQIGIHF